MTGQQRSLKSRMAAHSLHAQRDSRETTSAARKAFLERFENEVDPDRLLTEEERQRRALHARKAYFTRLALKSAMARSRRKGAA